MLLTHNFSGIRNGTTKDKTEGRKVMSHTVTRKGGSHIQRGLRAADRFGVASVVITARDRADQRERRKIQADIIHAETLAPLPGMESLCALARELSEHSDWLGRFQTRDTVNDCPCVDSDGRNIAGLHEGADEMAHEAWLVGVRLPEIERLIDGQRGNLTQAKSAAYSRDKAAWKAKKKAVEA